MHEAELRGELERLRADTPGVAGALATSPDGLVLAVDAPDLEPDGFAALTAAAAAVGVRLTGAAGQGDFRELLVRGDAGGLALFPAGSGILTVLAAPGADLPGLRPEARACATRIAHHLSPTEAHIV
ncbi:roadblock/LC7 domain-containing protein [Actinacidiphila acidipaludis]|uniref:Roadblock/LC7 domain-containing protein n=1 Tax=Actinacidiphila acidipaludis TaxID=2873382 RepID=A0ABS7Q4X0_9ACTN|nr:roadblock/LC7 domain-containing protein [Streptomyces acidipaludis]MBY8878198.1 roadblock/LC7 domain-containing protein [Streptomyces acidipaludis]